MTSMSKDVDIDKLDDIVNECNNAYHRTIKMKPVMLKIIHILTQWSCNALMIKILNLNLLIL